MKTAVTLAVLFLFALCGQAADKEDANKEDPIVGNWRWNNKHRVEFHKDGSVTSPWGAGKWKVLPSTSVERKYEIDWDANATVSKFILSASGRSFDGKNNRGQRESSVKLE